MDTGQVTAIIDAALNDGRTALLEPEGLALLAAMGLHTPASVFIPAPGVADPGRFMALPGERAVVKVVSADILHKSDVGGVAIVPKTPAAVGAAITDMQARLGARGVRGYTVSECIPYASQLGHELIIGLRWTEDLGPVISVGAGGIHTEFLAAHFRPGHDLAVFAPSLATPDTIRAGLDRIAVVQLMTRRHRGQPAKTTLDNLVTVVQAFLDLAASAGDRLEECEVNPLVIAADGRLVALDILATVRRTARRAQDANRPIEKLGRLLHPSSAAIMGVSERMNPGHIIVNNLLREGFDRERLFIVKPGSETIEGCRCVPDIASLPERVDLFVLTVDAAQASHALVEIIERAAAESVILIPGGLEEKSGSETIVRRMHEALARARTEPWRGPVINGGNCLGIRSLPGRYDTTFIPGYKFPAPAGAPSRVAIIAQSGAFALGRGNKLAVLNPKYSVTLGNQMDLTIGDYLSFLQDDRDIDVFAVYVEGFKPGDGLRFLDAARRIVASGRRVLLYRAGRTREGAQASASHTASIAGDYAVIRALCASTGVMVADSVADFEDLTILCAGLAGRPLGGRRLAAVSNAGFECVAVADNLGHFELAGFSDTTRRQLESVFAANRIAHLVDVHNPIDLTPMTADAGYVETVAAWLEAPESDVVVVGCVPFSPAVQTLPRGAGHAEDLDAPTSIVSGLARLRQSSPKPWVAVVDAGSLYDPMVHALLRAGIPTFRTADRALRLLNLYAEATAHAFQRGTTA